ncbi:MAG: lycopene cyclase family protein [Ginsengibacter sp.]
MQATQYNYVFLGAGCASLSIILRMIDSPFFSDKKILIIDKEKKINNDRTWCFWEKEDGFFEKIVFKRWSNLFFKTDDQSIPLDVHPYEYKMIRGIDFYEYCFAKIESQKNIDIIYGSISFENEDTFSKIKIDSENIFFNKKALIFNSIYQPETKQKDKFYLLQHFKGWIVETPGDFFNSSEAVLMDFRVTQKHGTTFGYVLPLSSTRALVEYTLFTENILLREEYDIALKDYLKNHLGLENYRIIDAEFGVIPMTNARFPAYRNQMYYVGTAGGQTKASTGYTFKFIQAQADAITKALSTGKDLKRKNYRNRFYFYDSTLLHILSKRLMEGKEIFSILFEKNKAATVLKFLDNDTSIPEELKLLNSLPKKVFIKAGFKELLKMPG